MYITIKGLCEAFLIFFFLVKHCKKVKERHEQHLSTSAKVMGTLYRASWSFSLVLIMPQNGTNAHALHALRGIFLPKNPDSVLNIEARYTEFSLSAACNASSDPEARKIPVEGYIQLSKGTICLFDLHRWVPNTEWTAVGGQLIRNCDYKQYSASKEDTTVYIHQQIHGMPALGKGGGSKPKPGKVCQ